MDPTKPSPGASAGVNAGEKRLQNDLLTDPTSDVASHELGLGKKSKRDLAEEYARELPRATGLADAGRLVDGLEILLQLEKRARLGGDTTTCGDAALAMLKLCKRAGDWTELNAAVVLVFKRRSQFKSVMTKVMQEAAEYVPAAPSRAAELELIKTLRHVSEGKLFLEVERARLTKRLAEIREGEGDVAGAADVLQEESVENYSGMERREKLEYILEQLRLVLAKRDYVRALIVSRKVQRKLLEDATLEDVKIRFHRLLIEYHLHEREALDAARSHLAVFRCASVKARAATWPSPDADAALDDLRLAAVLLALSPHEAHQHDELRRALLEPEMERVPAFRALLTRFTTLEIAPWPLPESETLAQLPLLAQDEAWRRALHDRVVEHNIRVAAGYYTRIRVSRLAEFLGLDAATAEAHIARMVSSPPATSEGQSTRLFAKIDRPAGVVVFAKRKDADERLSELTSDVGKLLDLVELTVHLVHKENMTHAQVAAAREREGQGVGGGVGAGAGAGAGAEGQALVGGGDAAPSV